MTHSLLQRWASAKNSLSAPRGRLVRESDASWRPLALSCLVLRLGVRACTLTSIPATFWWIEASRAFHVRRSRDSASVARSDAKTTTVDRRAVTPPDQTPFFHDTASDGNLKSDFDVLHVVEASLGGVRRYIEEIVAGSEQFAHGQLSLVYADARSDSQFGALVERAKKAGWETIRVPMIRATRPIADARSASILRGVIRRTTPGVVHLHSSKAGGVGRVAVRTLRRPRPSVVYSPHAMGKEWQYRLIE